MDVALITAPGLTELAKSLKEVLQALGLSATVVPANRFFRGKGQFDTTVETAAWVFCWDKSLSENTKVLQVLYASRTETDRLRLTQKPIDAPILCGTGQGESLPLGIARSEFIDLEDWHYVSLPTNLNAQEDATNCLGAFVARLDNAVRLNGLALDLYKAITQPAPAKRVTDVLELFQRARPSIERGSAGVAAGVLKQIETESRKYVSTDVSLVGDEACQLLFDFLSAYAKEKKAVPLPRSQLEAKFGTDWKVTAARLGHRLSFLSALGDIGSRRVPNLLALIYDREKDHPLEDIPGFEPEIGTQLHAYLLKYQNDYKSVVTSAGYRYYTPGEVRRFVEKKQGQYKVEVAVPRGNAEGVIVGGWDRRFHILARVEGKSAPADGDATTRDAFEFGFRWIGGEDLRDDVVAGDRAPDGTIVLGGRSGAIYVSRSGFVDLSDRVMIKGENARVKFVKFGGPEGTHLLIGWTNGILKLTEGLGTDQPKEWRGEIAGLADAAIGPSGDWIGAVGENPQVEILLSQPGGRLDRSFSVPSTDGVGKSHAMIAKQGKLRCCLLNAIAVLPGREAKPDRVLTAGEDGRVVVWEVLTGLPTPKK